MRPTMVAVSTVFILYDPSSLAILEIGFAAAWHHYRFTTFNKSTSVSLKYVAACSGGTGLM